MAEQELSPPAFPIKSDAPASRGTGKRAALYTRISTGDQHAETQLYDLGELAKQRRFEVVNEYADIISGAKSKRHDLDVVPVAARQSRQKRAPLSGSAG